MKFLLFMTDFIVPLVIFGIISYGILMEVNVYDTFIKGAKSGFFTVIKIMPTLVGLMVAVGILRASGFLDFISEIIGGITAFAGFPGELVPLTVVKMFSSSAATGLLLDLFKEFGTDSYIGLIGSISMSCTETIFYTMSVYFMTAKVTKTRYTLTGALLSTLAGLAASVVLAGITGVVCTGYFRILSYRFPRPLSCGFFHTLRAATIPTIYRILISIVGLSCKR